MKWHLVVAVAASSLSLVGQTPVPPAPAGAAPSSQDPVRPSSEQNRVDQRAQSMRQQIESGRAVHSHVRVQVRLKNGNKLVGVVKDGKLVERVDGLRFVEAQAKDRGAGIRLWYTGGTRNFVFVPFGDFAEYEVLQQLSNKQLLAIENDMQMNERRAAERAASASQPPASPPPAAPSGEPAAGQPPAPTPNPAEPPADPETLGVVQAPPMKLPGEVAKAKTEKGKTDKTGKETTPAPAKTEQEQQRAWFTLLQEYPPEAGWCRKKRDEITRRKVVVGANPSASEQRFVENFEQWLKACAHFGVSPDGKPAEASEEVDADQRPSRRKK